MLPKLRIILAAVFATCAALLALSAGMLGARPPGDDLSGVPEISRTLVRQAIVAEPDRQQVQLLAYSRRADELLRLRDLPVAPARAVVDYAEQAQARAAETASTPAVTLPMESMTAAAAAASESGPAADAPAAPAADSAAGATPPTDALPPAMIAMAPAANPHGDTTAAIPLQPASPPPVTPDTAAAPNEAPAETAAPAASGDTQVAAVAPGGSATAETYGPEKPKADAKPRHRAKVAHPHPSKPKKKVQVVVANPRAPPTTSNGFPVNESNNLNPVNQPNTRNNASGGWRYESTAR